MTQPRIEDDIKFLWGEVKKGFSFLFDYYKGVYEDYKKDSEIESWKEGPFPKIKKGFVVFLVILSFIIFSLWRNIESLFFLGFLAIIFYEIVFQKEWILPFVKEVILILYSWAKSFLIWVYNTIIEEGQKLFWWAIDAIKDILLFAWSIVTDIFDGLLSFTKEILGDIFGLVKEILSGTLQLVVEIISDLIGGIFEMIGFKKTS